METSNYTRQEVCCVTLLKQMEATMFFWLGFVVFQATVLTAAVALSDDNSDPTLWWS